MKDLLEIFQEEKNEKKQNCGTDFEEHIQLIEQTLRQFKSALNSPNQIQALLKFDKKDFLAEKMDSIESKLHQQRTLLEENFFDKSINLDFEEKFN